MATEVTTAGMRQVAAATNGTAKTDGRRSVETSLNYYDDPGDGSPPTPVLIGRTTVTNERPTVAARVTVTDITGHEDRYTLDGCGFQLVRHETRTSCRDDGYRDEGRIQSEYFPEAEQLLKDVTGASRAFIFDHKVRRGPSNWHKLGADNSSKRGPLHRVHVDQSYRGAEFLVRWYLADEADGLLGRRWQIINAWRPIKTIRRDPLAVADARSIPDADLVAARVVYADHERETWAVRPGPSHRWYYKAAQAPGEVMLIKCFDAAASSSAGGEGVVACRVPHSAFVDPQAEGDDVEPRESIEVRAFVFYDE